LADDRILRFDGLYERRTQDKIIPVSKIFKDKKKEYKIEIRYAKELAKVKKCKIEDFKFRQNQLLYQPS
jgi:hypothetical protein